MESGIAYFSAKLGLISSRRPPSPVKFAPTMFPLVGPGPVSFLRVPGRPDEAARVVSVSQMAPLLTMAGPADRLTHAARALLQARTAEVIVKCANDRDRTSADAYLKAAERTWATVAALPSGGQERIGVKAVREALESLAPDAPTT